MDVGFVWTLLGIDESSASTAHLALPCTAPRTDSGETCTSDLPNATPMVAGVDTCFRMGCEASGVIVVDVYATPLSHRLPDDRVPMSYATGAPYPSGMVTYSPNPLTHWRYDVSQSGVTRVSAMLQRSAVLARPTGGALDFSFNGQTSGTSGTSGTDYSTTLSFPAISKAGVVEMTF